MHLNKMKNRCELVLRHEEMEETISAFNSPLRIKYKQKSRKMSLKENIKILNMNQSRIQKHNVKSSQLPNNNKNRKSKTSLLSLRVNISLTFLTVILYFLLNQQPVDACLCHLIPNFQCPPPPHCCESGQYAKDECGCCLTCAKEELQPCGGPSGAHGKCASGLQCLKTCSEYTSKLLFLGLQYD